MPILCYSFDPNLAIDADNEAYITYDRPTTIEL